MSDHWLTDEFENHRDHLRGVAFRILGSLADAEDAVQEAWLKVSRADTSDVNNLGGWLTTIVARVSFDALRARDSRREDEIDDMPVAAPTIAGNPEQEAQLADSVGLALLVVLDRLTPTERLAFVLHDMFAVPFNEIGRILGKNATAARQLASRARRRVQGGEVPPRDTIGEHRRVVDAFLSALRAGDFEGLVAVLHPDVRVYADAATGRTGQASEIRGAETWARGAVNFGRMAQGVQSALINGEPGLVWAPAGKLQRVIRMTVKDHRITDVAIISDRNSLDKLTFAVI